MNAASTSDRMQVDNDESSFHSSDISLGSSDSSEEDVLMGMPPANDASNGAMADPFDDNSTISTQEPDDLEDDDDDDDDEPMEYEDSLDLTLVVANNGTTVMVEARGLVPLQEAGHLTIMSRLETSLSLSCVTSLLGIVDSTFLKELKFSQVSLRGSMVEYEDFSRALKALNNMEEFHMVDCCLHNTSGARPLDTILLQGLSSDAHLPKLRHIELYAVDIDVVPSGSFLSSQALGDLIRRKQTLTKLSFEDLLLDDDHVIELARALEDHTNLNMLKLWGCAVTDPGMVAIAKMLQKNKIVQNLELSYNEIGDVGCVALAKSLEEHNKTLKDLRLVQNDKIVTGGQGYKALLEMIKSNHVLEELLLKPDPGADPDLGFYLFVNKHRYLLENENITRGQLVDLLHEQQNNLTFLYLFLKAKPSLCGH